MYLIFLLIVFTSHSLIAVNNLQETTIQDSINIPFEIQCLVNSYPDFFEKADSEYLYWKDGEKTKYDDDVKNKKFDELLNNPSVLDMFAFCYPEGRQEKPPDENYDPGRIRYEPIFYKMYGSTKKEALKNMTKINWHGRNLRVTKINGVDEKLREVLKELDKLPKKFRKYYTKTAGTFNWRSIAGTDRKSVHSFAIAIDINTKYSNYWRWSKPDSKGLYPYKNSIPYEIVEIFEKHGFIWGGKWYHYDTMHFEYRPEILACSCN